MCQVQMLVLVQLLDWWQQEQGYNKLVNYMT